MEAGSGLAAFVAGLLTALNPCVLPLLPIVFAAAISKHRIAGPLALAAGLAISFVIIGFVLALGGQTVTGLGAERLRPIGGAILILIGVVLLVPRIQEALQRAAGPATNWISSRFGRAGTGGWTGQFGLGLVLGLVWSPCAGPTIGVASAIAYSGENLGALIGILLIFGFGAAIPLVIIGFLSRTVMMRWRDRLATIAFIGKIVLGILMIAIGILIVTGLDRQLEGWLGSILPVWLSDLTVRY